MIEDVEVCIGHGSYLGKDLWGGYKLKKICV